MDWQKAAGEAVAAKQPPHRRGSVPALGLRAETVCFVIEPQTGFNWRFAMWNSSLIPNWEKHCSCVDAKVHGRGTRFCKRTVCPKLDELEDRTVLSSSQALGFDAAVTTFVGGTPNKTAVGDLDAILHFRTQDTILRDLYEQMLIDDDDENGVLDSTNQELQVVLSSGPWTETNLKATIR